MKNQIREENTLLRSFARRVQDSLQNDGFAKTCKLVLNSAAARFRYLQYEPACKVQPGAPSDCFENESGRPRIAVQIHLFYLELLDELITYTNYIPYGFDCYISTDSEQKAETIRQGFAKISRAHYTNVQVFPNRGRDVAPFLLQIAPVIDNYDYLLHLHSKYSKHDGFGNRWRVHLMNSLLAGTNYIAALLSKLESTEQLGLIFPTTFWRVKPSLGWKQNLEESRKLMARMGLDSALPRSPQFPAGNMFWAKTAAVRPIFRCGLTLEDFPEEAGQLDGTVAHGIERCWGCIAASQGYGFLRVCPKKPDSKQ